MHARNFYEVLGVERSATPHEIRAAYRRLVRELHPDGRPALPEEVRDRLHDVFEAYAVLGRTDRRAAYDAALERNERAVWAVAPDPRAYGRFWLGPRTPAEEPISEAAILDLLFRWFR